MPLGHSIELQMTMIEITRDEWNAHLERLSAMLRLAENEMGHFKEIESTVMQLKAEVMNDPNTGRESLRGYVHETTEAIKKDLENRSEALRQELEFRTSAIRSDIRSSKRWILAILTAMLLTIAGAALEVFFRPYTSAAALKPPPAASSEQYHP